MKETATFEPASEGAALKHDGPPEDLKDLLDLIKMGPPKMS